MKNILKKVATLLLTVLLLVGVLPISGQTAEAANPYMNMTAETTENVLQGWQKVNGKRYYYEDGKTVKKWKTINGKTYYFDNKGVLQTDKMISKISTLIRRGY